MAAMHPFQRHAAALLPFCPPEAPALPPPLGEDGYERALSRLLRSVGHRPGAHVLLLGLGAGRAARDLARRLPPRTRFTVLEPQPRRVAAILAHEPEQPPWWGSPWRQLLTDTSPWSILLLLQAHGGLENLLPLGCPEPLPPEEAEACAALRRLLLRVREAPLPLASGPLPRLSVAAMLRPDEPCLDAFCAQLPDWPLELVLLWDAAAPPGHDLRPPLPLREEARPLAGDFAAQRNALLAACSGDWVLMLDGDERLGPETWAALPGLLRQTEQQGWWFPRRTFHPDPEHCLSGLGLWPDLQLRLFRPAPGVGFVNRVHERLEGLTGSTAIVPGLPILHLNRLPPFASRLEDKLALFSTASGITHRNSPDYPHLPVSFFTDLEQRTGGTCIQLGA